MFLASVVASAGLRMASRGIAVLLQGIVHLGLLDDRDSRARRRPSSPRGAPVPILTAGAESAAAKANGLATMKRGAALHGAPRSASSRGMPCAARGDSTAGPDDGQSHETEQVHSLASTEDRPRRASDDRARRGCEWAKRDSNPRHPACKAGALNQLSYSPWIEQAPHHDVGITAMRRDRAVTTDTPATGRCRAERARSIPPPAAPPPALGMPGGEGQIPRDEHDHRSGQDDEIAAGQQEAARGRSAACRGHRGARTGHKSWRLLPIPGRVKFRSAARFRAPRPIPRRAPPGAPDPPGAGAGPATSTSRATTSHPPPAMSQLTRLYRRRTRCAATPARSGPMERPVVASTAASKSSPASSRPSSGVRVPAGFRRASSATAETARA